MVEQEFAEFARARWERLVGSAVLLGCAPLDAEDLAQVTLMRAFAAWSKVRRADDRDAYVYTILLNAHRERYRRRRWREVTSEDPARSEPPAESLVFDEVDEVDAVVRALALLDIDQRQAIVLRYYLQLTDTQISEALRIPLGTVKSRISRGLARLGKDTGLTDNKAGR